jgi:hypothetical protein
MRFGDNGLAIHRHYLGYFTDAVQATPETMKRIYPSDEACSAFV